MKYLQFILESESNKKLDLLSKKIIKAAKQSGVVKAGPIPSKGKRIIFLYHPTTDLLDKLLEIEVSNKVSVTMNELEMDVETT